MLSFSERELIAGYIDEYLKMSNLPVNSFTVITVLMLEGLLDEAKIKSFIEERKENIK